MKNLRIAIFGLILMLGVVLAVGSLIAQSPAPGPPPAPEERARVMRFDGRGSQIGVMVDDASDGVRIGDVDEDSPAAKAGLREGDTVVEFDGERVRSARQFSRLVEETVSGRAVKIVVQRDGTRHTLDVTPQNRALVWGVDGDRIGREVARRMREMEPRLREIEPRLRQFRIDPPAFDFDFDFAPGVGGRLGVRVESLSAQLAEYFGVKDGGVLVSSVTADSAAARAGLRAGDVITSIDGDRVRDYDDLISELRGKSGDVTIGIVRDKKESTLKTTIEASPPRVRRPVRPVI
jgi:S1-C subfamily serine protease